MPAGRPTKYDPAICERVVEMGKEGFSRAEMALDLDIDYTTFLAWQDRHEEFSKAVKRAVGFSQGWWEKKGRLGAVGEVENFNNVGYIFNMKNRFKDDWRDKHDHEVSGGLSVNIGSKDSDL